MNVIINGRFLTQRTTGVQRYAREVLSALSTLVSGRTGQGAGYAFRLGLPADGAGLVPDFLKFADPVSGRWRGYAWEQLEFSRRSELSLNLCNLAPVLARRKVVCIHDANTILAPYSYSRKYRAAQRVSMPVLGRTASAVVTVSNESARALRQFGIVSGSQTIHVIPNGHEHVYAWRPEAAKLDLAAVTNRPFVLMLGSMAPHKNLELIRTIAPTLAERGFDCIVTGHVAEVFSVGARGGQARVHQVGYVSDDDIALLLSRAVCLLFPSYVEGFGLPIIEAMALGCPVIASNRSCMPEICAAAAPLLPPDDGQAWIEAITRFAADAAWRDGYVRAGRARVQAYTWKASAQKYLDLIEQLLEPRHNGARRLGAERLDSKVAEL